MISQFDGVKVSHHLEFCKNTFRITKLIKALGPFQIITNIHCDTEQNNQNIFN